MAWHDRWEAKRYALTAFWLLLMASLIASQIASRMTSLIRYALAKLRETGTKLKEPALSHAFDHWAADTASAQHDAAWAALQAQSKTLEAQLRQTRFENKKGTMRHVAQVISTDGH